MFILLEIQGLSCAKGWNSQNARELMLASRIAVKPTLVRTPLAKSFTELPYNDCSPWSQLSKLFPHNPESRAKPDSSGIG